MKQAITIKYGSLLKSVELPMRFSPVSLEECIQSVFHCKQKGIFGLRLINSIHIYPIEAIKSPDELLALCTDDTKVFSIVFQNAVSDYRVKEVRLTEDGMTAYLESIGVTGLNTPDDFSRVCCSLFVSTFQRIHSQCSSTDRVMELLSIESVENLTAKSLYDAFVKLVEIPFNERLSRLFQFVDSNADAMITYQEVVRLFSLLFWQESCCFVTGELCSSQGAYFIQQGQSISTRFIADFLIHDQCSFDSVLFWVMNRGNSIFTPSYYSCRSEALLQATRAPPQQARGVEASQNIEADMEFVYFVSSLYRNMVATHTPCRSFIDCVSGYVNEENEVSDEDLASVLKSFFGVKEGEADSEFLSNLHDLCELTATLFHTSEEDQGVSVNALVTLFLVLEFLTTLRCESTAASLVLFFADIDNPSLVPRSAIRSFFLTVIQIMTGVCLVRKDAGVSITLLLNQKTRSTQQQVADDIVQRFVAFASLAHVTDEALKSQLQQELDGGDGVHAAVFSVMIQYLLLVFVQQWNYSQMIFMLTQLLASPRLDSFLRPSTTVDRIGLLKEAPVTLLLEEEDDAPLSKDDVAVLLGRSYALPEKGGEEVKRDVKEDMKEQKEEQKEEEKKEEEQKEEQKEEKKEEKEEQKEEMKPEREANNKPEAAVPITRTASVMETGVTAQPAQNHINIFSDNSSIGIYLRYLTRKWSARLHLRQLTTPTLLHLFADFDHYSGNEDNMFLSEFLELFSALHKEDCIPKAAVKFFFHLTHASPYCINRYELLCALSLLCCDIHVGSNAERLWDVLQRVSGLTDGIRSFTVFVRAVISLINMMTPQLILHFHQDAEILYVSLSEALLASYAASTPSYAADPIIRRDAFFAWARDAFCIDRLMRYGCSLLNGHVNTLQYRLGIAWTSFHDIVAAVDSIDEGDGTFSCAAFVRMMNDNFPLPPFSDQHTQRGELFSWLVSLLAEGGRMKKVEVEAAFCVILNQSRDELWSELLELVATQENKVEKETVRTILNSLIKMSLFVEIGVFNASLMKCFAPVLDCICRDLPALCPIATVREVLYSNLELVLPSSYQPRLADCPVLLATAVLNLRVLAGLANTLFTHLHSMLASFAPTLTKGDYVRFIEMLAASKPLAPQMVYDIYARLYHCAEALMPQKGGISRDSLLLLLSAFYPKNTAMAGLLFSHLTSQTLLPYSQLVLYLKHVYTALNEFFDCFDMSLVCIEQVAMNVADACFRQFSLARSDALSQEQFVQWMRAGGACVVTKDAAALTHYQPLVHKNVVVTFDMLVAPLPAGMNDPKTMYTLPKNDDPRLQICVDQLAAFAAGMNFSICDEVLIDAIKSQCDPHGDVARSSFIAAIAMILLKRYNIEVNESKELLLEKSVQLSADGQDSVSIRKGLGSLFDCLDYHHTHFVSASLLVGSLGLLSSGSIDSRLRFLITEGCEPVGDMVYVSSLRPVVLTLFLVMDMLMPSVASYLKTTPLCSTQRVLKALGEDTEDGLMEISEVVSLLHEELIAMSATLREVTSQDKAEACSIHAALQHFAIPLKDANTLLAALLLAPCTSDRAPQFLTEQEVAETQWSEGLLRRTLNRVLLRDELRRLFSLLELSMPFKAREGFETMLMEVVGKDDEIRYEHLVYALLPFILLPVNSVSVVSKCYYDIIARLNGVKELSFLMLKEAILVMVRVWLWAIDKPTLLSVAQVDGLLKELVEVDDEEKAVVRCASFVGGCVLQASEPSSLSMQRFLAILLKPAAYSIKRIWEGEMPSVA